MIITDHARERLQERCGIHKKNQLRNVKLARKRGLRAKELKTQSDKMKEYLYILHGKYLKYNHGIDIRVHNFHTYVFNKTGQILITVLPLEDELKKEVETILERKVQKKEQPTYERPILNTPVSRNWLYQPDENWLPCKRIQWACGEDTCTLCGKCITLQERLKFSVS